MVFTTRKRNHCKNAKAPKKNERLSSPWLVDNLYHKPRSDRSVAYTWKKTVRWSTQSRREC